MKKIEQQICESFDQMIHKPTSDCVTLSSRDLINLRFAGKVDYHLHSNIVFWHNHNRNQFYFSLRSYNTVTTRSRLRALLSYFCHAQLYMKNGKLLLITSDGVKHDINANDIYSLTADEKFKNIA